MDKQRMAWFELNRILQENGIYPLDAAVLVKRELYKANEVLRKSFDLDAQDTIERHEHLMVAIAEFCQKWAAEVE